MEHGNLLGKGVHMQRHRVGARGHTTVLPLPLQELFAELMQLSAAEKERQAPSLPRTGAEIADIVKVLIKGPDEDMRKCIAQANVRRDVVVELILEAKARGHWSYQLLDEALVREKSSRLPENGIPAELLHLFEQNDASLDRVQPQKAATPVAGRVDGALAFYNHRPNAVSDEKSGQDGGDVNSKRVAALQSLVYKLNTKTGQHDDRMQRLVVSTGSQMIDQFQPWYFAIAFAFCFRSCIACPDLENRPRFRRKGSAPHVPIRRWCELIARRVEAQFQRDWCLTYSLWNYICRTSVNLSRTVYAYDSAKGTSNQRISGEVLEQAAISICKALKGKYIGPDKKVRSVNGDMTKVR